MPEPLIAFRRSAAQERLLIVLNLGDSAVPLPDTLLATACLVNGHGFDPPQHSILPRYGMYFGLESAEAEMRPLASAA